MRKALKERNEAKYFEEKNRYFSISEQTNEEHSKKKNNKEIKTEIGKNQRANDKYLQWAERVKVTVGSSKGKDGY